MSDDKLDEIARRVARWALREPALEAEVAVIRAAIDEAVAERDREWREALGVVEKDCPHPAFAQTWLRSSVSDAVAEERRALREIIVGETWAPCKCRSASHGWDSRIVDQEHWGDCGEWTRERLLAALAAREAKP
jgi:hypothetical protein